MALTDVTVGITTCPECGNYGPYNFKLEDRISLRRLDASKEVYTIADTTRVVVCCKCGHGVKILG